MAIHSLNKTVISHPNVFKIWCRWEGHISDYSRVCFNHYIEDLFKNKKVTSYSNHSKNTGVNFVNSNTSNLIQCVALQLVNTYINLNHKKGGH